MTASWARGSASAGGTAIGASMTDNRPEQFFRDIVAMLGQEQPFALATVVPTSGSTPQKAGARALILPDGRILGTLGAGCVEAESRRRALDMIQVVRSRGSGFGPESQPDTLLLDLHLDDDFVSD